MMIFVGFLIGSFLILVAYTYRLKKKLVEARFKLQVAETLSAERQVLFEKAEKTLSESFKSVSTDVLQQNSKSFLEIANLTFEKWQERAKGDFNLRQAAIGELVKPLGETLSKVQSQIGELEKSRISAYSSLLGQVKDLAVCQTNLEKETGNLVRALRSPSVRGRWGEIQLKKVVEMAGMVSHCDFEEQVSGDSGRPDMVVRLPAEKCVVVDSKAPLMAYLEAVECDDDEKKLDHLKQHAKQIRWHVEKLGAKAYWNQFPLAPEFVVLFLPGEPFFSAALEHDPELIEYSAKKQVILATPTTLIALLRAVAYGWKQDVIAENAKKLGELGHVFSTRLSTFSKHFTDLQKHLERTIAAYNRAVGSYEARLVPAAEQLKACGCAPTCSFNGEDEISGISKIVVRPEKTL